MLPFTTFHLKLFYPPSSGIAACVGTVDTAMCHSSLAQPCLVAKGSHWLGRISRLELSALSVGLFSSQHSHSTSSAIFSRSLNWKFVNVFSSRELHFTNSFYIIIHIKHIYYSRSKHNCKSDGITNNVCCCHGFGHIQLIMFVVVMFRSYSIGHLGSVKFVKNTF